jgi:chemotaxis response regulator CheB
MSGVLTVPPLVQVVDDDRDIREALCDLLEAWGYRTVAASNGHEAFKYLAVGEKPALIMLDLMMPVMDGLRFREEQLKHPQYSAIPVIAISAGGPRSVPWTWMFCASPSVSRPSLLVYGATAELSARLRLRPAGQVRDARQKRIHLPLAAEVVGGGGRA